MFSPKYPPNFGVRIHLIMQATLNLQHYFLQSCFYTEANPQALGSDPVLVAGGSSATTALCKARAVNAAVFRCGPTCSFVQVPGTRRDDPGQPCNS